MSYERLGKHLYERNRTEYESEKKKINYDMREMKLRVKTLKTDLINLEDEFDIDEKEIIKKLKKLRFISSFEFSDGYIKILTKDLKFDYNSARNPKSNVSGNLGPYLISFEQDLVFADPTITRIKGNVKSGGGSAIYAHFFVKNGELCMGSGNTQNQYYKFITQGRIDLALGIIWNLLTLGSQRDIEPYIYPKDFIHAMKKEGVA